MYSSKTTIKCIFSLAAEFSNMTTDHKMGHAYFADLPNPLARFSLVSAASLSVCITRAFRFLVSSILIGFDSGRFWGSVGTKIQSVISRGGKKFLLFLWHMGSILNCWKKNMSPLRWFKNKLRATLSKDETKMLTFTIHLYLYKAFTLCGGRPIVCILSLLCVSNFTLTINFKVANLRGEGESLTTQRNDTNF